MKKSILLFFIISMLLCTSITVSATGLLSPAISVMQTEVGVIKTGIGRNTVSFTASDFENALGDITFTAIEITKLPDVGDGILKLGAVDIVPGQAIPYEALCALRFIPAKSGAEASFEFKPYGSNYENAFACTVCMLDSLNFAPSAEDMKLAAMESISVFSSLSATDPDGDDLTYVILNAPKKGSVKLLDPATGSFMYTAADGKHGKDTFTYAAVDRYGNMSEAATVTINAAKNKTGIIYTDLANSPCHLSAAVMAEQGIYLGELIGGERFFYPEKTVTRAEFLIMAMNASGIDTKLCAAGDSGFADSADFTSYQNQYIATAKKLGLVVGIDTEDGRSFLPDNIITSVQASTILSRIARLNELSFADAVLASVDADEQISDDGYAMMASVGLTASEDMSAEITRADTVELLYTLQNCK